MSSSLFKFTKDGVTRRVTFPTTNVTWSDIASKIENIYGTPSDTVGVVYVDAEGDEITISTQEELQDYYRFHGITKNLIKFTVVDLASSRDKPLPDTPRTSRNLHGAGSRNTFGITPFNYEGDEDWQRIPGFTGVLTPSTDGMRFVELASDAGSRLNDDEINKGDSTAGSDSGSTTKGKSPHAAESISSNDSVLAHDTPVKPPVHVLNAEPSTSHQGSETTDSSSDAVPDPPLPDLDPPVGSTPPSLTNDVATLLSTITATFSSHPELSEGLRNILRNVGNGAYWATHREQVARAAEQIRRSSQDLHAQMLDSNTRSTDAEEQASRRIAEAVANIVRSLSDMAVNPNGPTGAHAATGVSGRLWSTFGQPRGHHDHHRGHHDHRRGHHHHPHGPHDHRSRSPHGRHGDHHRHPFRHWEGPPPPPHDPSSPWGWHAHPPPMPWMGPHPPPHAAESCDSEDDSDDVEDAEVSMYGVSQRLPLGVQKERLQTAKAAYIAEKQKYRQEKQARRREKMQRSSLNPENAANATTSAPPAPAGSSTREQQAPPVTQLISHGRGQFPPLELFSIPRRQPSQNAGRGRHQRQASASTSNTETSRARITRRLSDMGFNDPSIERRVGMHVPGDEIRGQAAEDTIINNVVEELLSQTSTAPNTSIRAERVD